MFLQHARVMQRIDPSTIGRLVSSGRHVHLHAGALCYRLRGSLCDVLQQLGGHPFVQVNRNEAVNLHRLQRVDHDAVHVDGVDLVLSRCYRADLIHQLTILNER